MRQAINDKDDNTATEDETTTKKQKCRGKRKVGIGEHPWFKGEGNKFFSTMRKISGCIRTNPTKQKNITLFTSKSI